MGAALVPLQNITLGSAAASVSFGSIPSTYRDLRIVVNAATSAEGNIFIQVNNDTGSNYSQVNMRASGGGAQSSSGTSTRIQSNYSTGLQTSSRAVNTYDVLDYAQTNKHKTILIRANHADEVDAIAGRWASTLAITSLKLTANDSGNFTIGSTFALYGVVA
jgi:hypothetical protein